MSFEMHAPAALPEGKALATALAQLALSGFAAHPTLIGGWLVSRHDAARYCPEPDDLIAFARTVGGAHEL